MNALFVCPYFQLAPLKVNRKVKEMSHCEYKCHSALRRNGKKGASKPGVSAGAKRLCFAVLSGSYKSKSGLRSAETVKHLKVSAELERGFGRCGCRGPRRQLPTLAVSRK